MSEFESDWTSPKSGVDFAGFAIPTTSDVAWGGEARVYEVHVTVDPNEEGQVVHEVTHVGSWVEARHGWEASTPGKGRRKPEIRGSGLYGLVRLVDERPTGSGASGHASTVSGRCLAEDKQRMRALAVSRAAMTARRIAEALLRQAKTLEATSGTMPP